MMEEEGVEERKEGERPGSPGLSPRPGEKEAPGSVVRPRSRGGGVSSQDGTTRAVMNATTKMAQVHAPPSQCNDIPLPGWHRHVILEGEVVGPAERCVAYWPPWDHRSEKAPRMLRSLPEVKEWLAICNAVDKIRLFSFDPDACLSTLPAQDATDRLVCSHNNGHPPVLRGATKPLASVPYGSPRKYSERDIYVAAALGFAIDRYFEFIDEETFMFTHVHELRGFRRSVVKDIIRQCKEEQSRRLQEDKLWRLEKLACRKFAVGTATTASNGTASHVGTASRGGASAAARSAAPPWNPRTQEDKTEQDETAEGGETMTAEGEEETEERDEATERTETSGILGVVTSGILGHIGSRVEEMDDEATLVSRSTLRSGASSLVPARQSTLFQATASPSRAAGDRGLLFGAAETELDEAAIRALLYPNQARGDAQGEEDEEVGGGIVDEQHLRGKEAEASYDDLAVCAARLSLPGVNLLYHALATMDAAELQVATPHIRQVCEGVYAFELLEPAYCARLFERARVFRAATRHNCSVVPGDTTMRPPRISLDKLGLASDVGDVLLERVVRPLAARLFPKEGGATLDHHLSFVDTRAAITRVQTAYDIPTRRSPKGFEAYDIAFQDDAEVVLDVCLHTAHEDDAVQPPPPPPPARGSHAALADKSAPAKRDQRTAAGHHREARRDEDEGHHRDDARSPSLPTREFLGSYLHPEVPAVGVDHTRVGHALLYLGSQRHRRIPASKERASLVLWCRSSIEREELAVDGDAYYEHERLYGPLDSTAVPHRHLRYNDVQDDDDDDDRNDDDDFDDLMENVHRKPHLEDNAQ